MKSFPLVLAGILAAFQSLFASFSGLGTEASPYLIGSVGSSATYQCSGLASGTAAKYYQFSTATAVAAGSTIWVQYDASTAAAYKLTFYQGATVLSGSYSFSGTQVFNGVTLASGLTAGSYKLSISRNPAAGATGPNFSINFRLSQSSNIRPVNDNWDTPIGFPDYGGVRTGSNVSATKYTNEPNHAGNAGGKSVWYAWQAPGAGSVVVSTAGSSFDTLLAVYTLPYGYLQAVVSNDDEGNGLKTSRVSFTAQQGAIYYIAVDGKNGASGNVVIALAEGGERPNTPLNLLPSNNSVDCSPSVTLKASPYGEINFYDNQAGSQWVVRSASNGSVVANVYVSGSANTAAMSGLPLGAKLSWQARHLDDHGLWSSFSPATMFTIAPSWPPSLSVSVVDALAVRVPLHSGTFRISRTGSSTPLKVRYTLSGATGGLDFVALSGSLTIPAGAASADLRITPIAAATPVKKKPLTIALQPVANHPITTGSATLSIRREIIPARLVAYRQGAFRIDLDGNGGTVEKTSYLNPGTARILFGDFSKSGPEQLVLWSGSNYRVVPITTGSLATTSFVSIGDAGFIGDLDGDGRDDLIIRRDNAFKADTAHNGGAPEIYFTVGTTGAQLILCSDGVHTGDWDGDGRDDVVVRNGNLFSIRRSSNGTIVQFTFGLATDAVYLADLNGDGKVEPVLRRAGSYIADVFHNQSSPKTLSFGTTTETAYATDLNGDGCDELVIQRGTQFLIDSNHDGGTAEKILTFGTLSDTVFPMRVR